MYSALCVKRPNIDSADAAVVGKWTHSHQEVFCGASYELQCHDFPVDVYQGHS